jgi:hypothetical protein
MNFVDTTKAGSAMVLPFSQLAVLLSDMLVENLKPQKFARYKPSIEKMVGI